MTADFIARVMICIVIGILLQVEVYFQRKARVMKATVLGRHAHIRETSTGMDPAGTTERAVKSLRVRLDPQTSDGREGHVAARDGDWKAAQAGDELDVLALPRKPVWLFWNDGARSVSMRGRLVYAYLLSAMLMIGTVAALWVSPW